MSIFLEILSSTWGVISSLFPFIVLLGVLVFIHELGHFMVARFCGVRVEVFSLGFGKKLFKWKKGDTVYCLSLFPLGGYVKMFGHEYGKEIAKEDQPVSFLHKKLWQRTAIVLAGPLMNFFLAVFIFAVLNMVSGDKKIHPVIGELESSSPVAQAGLKEGDKIISIDDHPVKSTQEVKEIIFNKANAVLNIKIQAPSEETYTRKVPSIKKQTNGKWGFLEKGGVIEGLNFFTPAPIVGVIDPKSFAAQAGLKTFDKVLSINGKKINNRKELFHLLSHPISSEVPWKLEIERKGKEVKQLTLNPPKEYHSSPDIEALGLVRTDLFIADLKKGGAADRAGLKKGDFIFKLNGKRLPSWKVLVEQIRNFDETKDPLKVEVKREGEIKTFSVTPEMKKQIVAGGVEKKYYMLGIITQPYMIPAGGIYVEKTKNPFKALIIGVNKTFHWCTIVAVYIKKIISGEVSRRTLGGAISIGRVAYDSYSYGFEYFFKIMAILSVQLFLLNILPIPVFDGGHLLFYVIEFFNGAPLSMKKMIIAHQIGFLFLLFLLIFTTFNDLHNWLFVW